MPDITLSDFHTLVADSLGRQTSLDSVIPKRVEMAARWLERNYTFQYMRNWRTFTASASATYPYIVSLDGLRLKRIDLIRRRDTADDGTIQFDRPLRKLMPADRETRPSGNPESYWLNGLSSIILNSVPEEDLTFEAHTIEFTSWGTGSTWTHWLLDNATELLLARTLMMMSVRTRDTELWNTYKSEFDLELQSFNVAEEDLQQEDVIEVWEPPEYASDDQSLRSA